MKKILSRLMRSRDPLSSQLYETMHAKTSLQDRKNVVARDEYRAEWHRRWAELDLDFVLTVPIAFPALKNDDSVKATLMSAGYALLFSLVSIWNTWSLSLTELHSLAGLYGRRYASDTRRQAFG